MLLIKCISKGLLQYQKLSFSTTCITRYLNCGRSLLKLRPVQASVGPLVSCLQVEAALHTGEVVKYVVCGHCFALCRLNIRGLNIRGLNMIEPTMTKSWFRTAFPDWFRIESEVTRGWTSPLTIPER